jgi:dienelactone hydrolase
MNVIGKWIATLHGVFFSALLLTSHAPGQVKTEVVEYRSGDVVLQGYVSYDRAVKEKRPGVLVIHDWLGASAYTKMRAEQLAALGYVALAADIYGKGIRPKDAQAASAEAGKYYRDRQLFRTRARAGLDELARHPMVDASKLGVMGYCFGGAASLELARSGAPVKAVVSFHGSLGTPDPADAKSIAGKVLVLHGADDPFVKPEEVAGFMNEMRAAGVDWQMVYYSGAVHSFTDQRAGNDNSRGAAYNENADRRSWEAMKNFFEETLRK